MFPRLFPFISFSSSFDEQYPFFPLEAVFPRPTLVVYNVAYIQIKANMTGCALCSLLLCEFDEARCWLRCQRDRNMRSERRAKSWHFERVCPATVMFLESYGCDLSFLHTSCFSISAVPNSYFSVLKDLVILLLTSQIQAFGKLSSHAFLISLSQHTPRVSLSPQSRGRSSDCHGRYLLSCSLLLAFDTVTIPSLTARSHGFPGCCWSQALRMGIFLGT